MRLLAFHGLKCRERAPATHPRVGNHAFGTHKGMYDEPPLRDGKLPRIRKVSGFGYDPRAASAFGVV